MRNGKNMAVTTYLQKKFITILTIIFLMIAVQINAQDLIRRTIAVLPVINTTEQREYDPMCQLIRDAMRSRMIGDEQFYFVNFSKIDAKAAELKYNDRDFSSNDKSVNLSLATGADVVVMSYLIIEDNSLVLYSDALDILTGETRVTTRIVGVSGIEKYNYIEELADEFAQRMRNDYPKMKRSQLEELMKQQTMVIEEEDDEIIQKLLQQKTKYSRLTVKRRMKSKDLAVPFGKNVIVFISNQYDEYTIEIGGKQFQSRKGLKIMAFDSQPGIYRDFVVTRAGQRPQKVRYRQKDEYEISLKRMYFDEEKPYKAFIDAGAHIGAAGDEVGIDIKAGFGLPVVKSISDNLYLHFGFNVHGNMLFNQKMRDMYVQAKTPPRFSLNFGVGYEHVFLVAKNLIGLHVGAEAGFKFSLISFLIQTNTDSILSFKERAINFAYPTFYLALPFTVEVYARRRVSLLIGVEPTLRVVFHVIGNEGSFFTDDPDVKSDNNYDRSFLIGLESLLWLRRGNVSFHLFFYNFPITIAARIRI